MTDPAHEARAALWARVEEALDARRDPLDDLELVADLEGEPGLLEATRRLTERLSQLAPREVEYAHPKPAPPSPLRRAAPLGPSVLVAAGVLVAIGGLIVFEGQLLRPPTATAPQPSATPAPEVTLIVEHQRPAPPHGRRRTLTPEPVLGWTLDRDRR